jgi:uncharacterized protein (UPF0333 family)
MRVLGSSFSGKNKEWKRKAQLSVEFFLVLSIIIAFSVILYNVSRDEVAKTKAVNSVVLAKNGLDSLSQAVDFVSLSGNGSALNVSFFVSKEANCFFYDAARDAFYCVIYSPSLQASVTSKQFVFGPRFTTRLTKTFQLSCRDAFPLRSGWWNARVASEGASVNVSCSPK